MSSIRKFVVRPALSALAVVGGASVVLGAMLAQPLKNPPILAQTITGARALDTSGLPALSRFIARDGTTLAYRLYPAANGASDQYAVIVHGTAGHSIGMNAVGKALAGAGVTTVAIDVRGHGASGTRGDISYIGQLDDDLADLMAELKWPAKPALLGHSGGGGLALRIARGPLADRFSRFVLAAPYLGHDAPSTQPQVGGARWAEIDMPRIIALKMMHSAGIACCESLQTLAFGVQPGTEKYVTSRYSFRLMANFGPPNQSYHDLSGLTAPLDIIAGADDEQMRASAYPQIAATGPNARAKLIPGVDHMGVLGHAEGLAAIVSAIKGERAP